MEIKDKIAKLTDVNGYKWTYDIKMLLKSKDLWKNCIYENIYNYQIDMLEHKDTEKIKKESIKEKETEEKN